MNLRTLILLLIMAAIAALAVLNWPLLATPTIMSLGLTTTEARLGLIMLALTALMAVMFLAYGGIALLLAGAPRNMGPSLTLTGLYAGTSLASSGATFPVQGARLLAQAWSQLLPFTAYLKLQAQQLDLGAAWTASLSLLGTLLLFVLVAGGAGLRLYARGARDPASWGQR